jgi:hypothetical protein
MALFTWNLKKPKSTNGASGAWETASNWSPAGIPGSVNPDDVLIELPGGYTVTTSSNLTINSLQLAGAANLDITNFSTDHYG